MPEAPPFETLQQIAGAFFLSRCLQVAAEFGVADALGDQPSTAEDLAAATATHAQSLGRVLNLLAAHGIFEQEAGAYRHTSASRLLRSDHPQSIRSFARMFGLPPLWSAAMNLDQVVKTGQTGETGEFWKYFEARPEAGAIFDEAMTAKARGQIASVVSAFDFSKYPWIGDIGGGRGHLLKAILEANPHVRGVLFDQMHVIQHAGAIASDRLSLRAGDFFKDALPVCDLYILMEVIHDWPDAEALAILRAVRRAAPAKAKLLLIEAPIPQEPGPSWTKTLDIVMLNLFGGSQRTINQYQALLEKAGFRLERTIDTGVSMAMLEAAAV